MGNPFYPERFHGLGKKDKYFEGWFYKLVTLDGQTVVSIIPGVSITKESSHAFIQFLLVSQRDGKTLSKTYYFRYPINMFSAASKLFDVSVSDSSFNYSQLRLDIDEDGVKINGLVNLIDVTPLKKSLFSPSVMGPFSYIPGLECYHGVLSMNHFLKGRIVVNGEVIDFNGGKGYLEKDWGHSFPSEYVWVQANNFSNSGVSIFFSYANVPFGAISIKGLISVVLHNGRMYRFNSFNGSRVIKEDLEKNKIFYKIKKGQYSLTVKASISQVSELPSPNHGAMNKKIKEGLSGIVTMRLEKNKKIIYEGTSHNSGIEIMKSNEVKK